MNFLVITSVVVALTVLVGALLAGLMVGLEQVVRKEPGSACRLLKASWRKWEERFL